MIKVPDAKLYDMDAIVIEVNKNVLPVLSRYLKK